MRYAGEENEAPGLFFRNNHFFNPAVLAKAHQGRSEYRDSFPASSVIVVAPHNARKADHDMRISLKSKIPGFQKLEHITALIRDGSQSFI